MKRISLPISLPKGFTLLEVLVALTIFTLCAAVVIKYASFNTSYLSRLESKTFATLIAEREVESLLFNHPWPDIGQHRNNYSELSNDWLTVTEVSETQKPYMRKLLVKVSLKSQENTLVQLTRYIGDPKEL